MAKLYDYMSLDKLAWSARSLDCPLMVLTLALQSYMPPRILRAGDAHSTTITPSNRIVAGCCNANGMSRLYLYDILERMHCVLFHALAPHSSWMIWANRVRQVANRKSSTT